MPPGTLICDEEDIVEQQVVTGIAFSKDEAQISIRNVEDKPGIAAAIFGPLADSSVNFAVRPWAASSDYWAVRSDLLEGVKKALEDNGLSIPYPQRDVHLIGQVAATG